MDSQTETVTVTYGNLKVNVSKSEAERKRRREEAEKFAHRIFEECQQQNFTVKQFETIVSILDFKRQLLNEHAADITRIKD